MNADDLFNAIGDSYSWVNIPDLEDAECRQKVVNILRVEVCADSQTVKELLTGMSWRERMVGHVLAVRKGPRPYVDAMFDSLADPRGLAIVPTCAALTLALAEEEPTEWTKRICSLDRSRFDGDIGWSLDKMAYHLGWSATDPGGTSPNDSKSFETHLALFHWVAAESDTPTSPQDNTP